MTRSRVASNKAGKPGNEAKCGIHKCMQSCIVQVSSEKGLRVQICNGITSITVPHVDSIAVKLVPKVVLAQA